MTPDCGRDTVRTLAANVAAREVVIRIAGDGGNAQYIEEGESAQEPVEVRVGDTVVWRNEGNRTHTATAENNDGDLLFDTTDIPGRSGASFSSSDPIEMTAEIFEVNTSTHYGRMVRVDDNTVILFGNMDEVFEYI